MNRLVLRAQRSPPVRIRELPTRSHLEELLARPLDIRRCPIEGHPHFDTRFGDVCPVCRALDSAW